MRLWQGCGTSRLDELDAGRYLAFQDLVDSSCTNKPWEPIYEDSSIETDPDSNGGKQTVTCSLYRDALTDRSEIDLKATS